MKAKEKSERAQFIKSLILESRWNRHFKIDTAYKIAITARFTNAH